MFLVHASYYNIQLASAFQSIVDSLWEIGRRWNGSASDLDTDNLASKFASRLLQAKQQGSYFADVRHAAYAQDSDQDISETIQLNDPSITEPQVHSQANHLGQLKSSGLAATETPYLDANALSFNTHDSPDSISMAFPPLPLAFQGHVTLQDSTVSSSERHGQMRLQPPPSANLNTSMESSMLNHFFDYDYMSSQRISMFSQSEKE
jgi:hypothetical protein